MAINANVGAKKEFELVPAGNHMARVYSIIHEGTLPGEYMGEPKMIDTVRIGFELPNEKKVFREGDEAKPFVISQEYTLSMGEKANLRHLVEGILGVGFLDEDAQTFDVTELMGRACMLNIVHKVSAKGNKYAKVMSAAPLPKGFEAPPQINNDFLLDYEEKWSEEKFGKLPEFLREKMQGSVEFKKKFKIADEIQYPEGEINPEDIPF